MLDGAKAKAILKVLQGCNSFTRLRKIQAQVIVCGLHCDPSISTQLLRFCAVSVSGSLAHAQLLFDKMPDPPTQAWNSIVRGFSQSHSPLLALAYYNRLLSDSLLARPDTFTFTFALKAVEKLKALPKCREIHGSIITTGYGRDTVVCTALTRCYAKNGSLEDARFLFDKMPERDLVAWNAMISCYSQAGRHEEAMEMYERMRNENVGLDAFSIVGLLSSCAHVGALGLGVQLHRIACDTGLVRNVFVGNALIDMYAKCGSLDDALSIFTGIRRRRRDVFTWNSMIHGFGVHGLGNDAISFFEQMLAAGMRPNSITFLGLLCGCSHQGLVREGVDYFHQMSSKFNLTPGIKHYGCLVDLYGRAGNLDKALETIETSPSRDDPVLWRILLGSSKIHKNVASGEKALRNLMRLGAVTAGDCVLLSTIYAGANYLSGFAKMRKLIKTLGVKTTPGWSWIEISNQVHKFVVDDKLHPDSMQVYEKLEEVTKRATSAGYVKEEPVILNLPGSWSEGGCSETPSSCHSEKLAIAYGLARTPEGTSLRIVKNLRVCKDCHSFTKFVSKAFNRSIVVRDRVRFHHFVDGVCSCGDYW
ncbi:unnamed protein product [Linum tenue]|uniref:DYW domain-containing protein n=1 Tax=Linum tenue TaxID=586396 RepID=A0AAV0N301_9ROSI|nr:unnamed protein product [Linum tenue]